MYRLQATCTGHRPDLYRSDSNPNLLWPTQTMISPPFSQEHSEWAGKIGKSPWQSCDLSLECAIQDQVGGWEADVSVLVSIPEGKRWETQMVIKESLTEGLFTEVWQGYKSQQGDMRCWEGFPPPGLKGQEREWHGVRPAWLEKRCPQQLWPQLEGPAKLHPGSEGEGRGGNQLLGPQISCPASYWLNAGEPSGAVCRGHLWGAEKSREEWRIDLRIKWDWPAHPIVERVSSRPQQVDEKLQWPLLGASDSLVWTVFQEVVGSEVEGHIRSPKHQDQRRLILIWYSVVSQFCFT